MNSLPSNLPTSHFPLPTSRPALTLVEVLIAMGILAVGLLGVASIFPVGGYYVQTGDVADRAGAVAQAALEDAVVQGYLDPKNWVVHDIHRVSANPGAFMKLISGEAPLPANRVLRGLRQSISDPALPTTVLGVSKANATLVRAGLFGGAYAIDPLGMMSALADPATNNTITANLNNSAPVRHFPAFAGLADEPTSNPALGTSDWYWNHWLANGLTWPVRRVTVFGSLPLMNGSTNAAKQYSRALPTALEMFTARDDLALQLPTDGDTPSRQRWRRVALGPPSARQSAREFSWLITVAPGSNVERDAWATRPDAYPVEVSTVVFNKRTLAQGIEASLQSERLVTARVVSSGPSGGEMLLERRTAGPQPGFPPGVYTQEPSTSPFESLRTGEYVMVVAPHPLSTEANPRLALHWCRVLSLEDTGTVEAGANNQTLALSRDQRVLVSLRGPDWPWQPAANLTDVTRLSNDLRVAILPGAVAVHTKTMRLEAGSEWSVD